MKHYLVLVYLFLSVFVSTAWAQVTQRVVDIPARPGVTQRIVLLGPDNPKSAVILFAGGHGGLRVTSGGDFKWGAGNFLVRTRELFAAHELLVAVVDAPSDRQRPPYLGGFRQTPEHVADIKAVIAWLKQQAKVPVWLVGTSRGTQSAAFVATQLAVADGGPDGLVLTSTMLSDDKGRPVPDMDLNKIAIPVLVVHHRQDGCKHCAYAKLPRLMDKLDAAPRKELLTIVGGQTRGDPCEAFAYHGFNGLEGDVVAKIADWIVAK
jgi:dienelactone hydrolase